MGVGMPSFRHPDIRPSIITSQYPDSPQIRVLFCLKMCNESQRYITLTIRFGQLQLGMLFRYIRDLASPLTLFNSVKKTLIGRTQHNSVYHKLGFIFYPFFFYLKKPHPDNPLVLITGGNLAKHAQRIQRSRHDELLVWSTQSRCLISLSKSDICDSSHRHPLTPCEYV
jgi:hypothetical protein